MMLATNDREHELAERYVDVLTKYLDTGTDMIVYQEDGSKRYVEIDGTLVDHKPVLIISIADKVLNKWFTKTVDISSSLIISAINAGYADIAELFMFSTYGMKKDFVYDELEKYLDAIGSDEESKFIIGTVAYMASLYSMDMYMIHEGDDMYGAR